MSGSVLNPRKLAILYYFGDLDYWKLPEIAVEALAGGFDGVALRKLAGLTNVSAKGLISSDITSSDINAAFKEMGVDAPISKDDARLALATECVKKAIDGESNVFRHRNAYPYPPVRMARLAPGAASNNRTFTASEECSASHMGRS